VRRVLGVERRRPGDEQHLVRVLDAADKGLLAVDHEFVAVTPGGRIDGERVCPRVGFGQAHTEAKVAVDDTREELLFLFWGPVTLNADPAEHRRQNENDPALATGA